MKWDVKKIEKTKRAATEKTWKKPTTTKGGSERIWPVGRKKRFIAIK